MLPAAAAESHDSDMAVDDTDVAEGLQTSAILPSACTSKARCTTHVQVCSRACVAHSSGMPQKLRAQPISLAISCSSPLSCTHFQMKSRLQFEMSSEG